jgi:D-alanyl-lipoteichoic acid acyltransferase DltB (MBOAT superfamily)
MLFNSIPFAFFLILTFIGYWFLVQKNLRLQNTFVFVVSYIFYGWWDWHFLFLIFFSSLLGFFLAWWMDTMQEDTKRKQILVFAITINLLFLAAFKYLNFFLKSTIDLLNTLGMKADPITLKWILPIGISFYTFHNISYLMDVYRRQIKATKDVTIYLSFMSYFPQLVAGPIQRAKDLIPQFEKPRTFNEAQAVLGLQQILWGLFKKVVVADTCAVYVNNAFSHYDTLSGLNLLLAIVFFAFQIYGDFSGYTDIALGVSKLFGIELTTNFKTPYFARSIPEFWRRWHISLTTWFKDYVYIPLGGNKNGLVNTLRNTLIIFLLSGFWHGANWTFLIWGLLNALYFIPYLFIEQRKLTSEYRLADFFRMLMVFTLICLAWVFFRASSLTEAFSYLQHLVQNPFWMNSETGTVPVSVLLPLVFLLFVEWKFFRIDGFRKVNFKVRWLAWLVYLILAFMVAMNLSFYKPNDFIYFQF